MLKAHRTASTFALMNFLAHARLSFNEPEILVGNMISDFVKGKKKFDYPKKILQGIVLHREIDQYTDSHEATKQAKSYFKADYGLYAGAFVDVVYDHFLAHDEHEFKNDHELASFAQQTYAELMPYMGVVPERFQVMFGYMRKQNWLYNYRLREGINNSFAGLVRRAVYMDDHASAMTSFDNHYLDLKNCYSFFFPEVKQFAHRQLQNTK
ncbi:MAG: ACP phosphodiesterase [Chitinophagales bacterium]